MTPDQRRAALRKILDRHNDAMSAFHDANAAFDTAMAGIRRTLDALQAANAAQGAAIDSVHAANLAALSLWNDEGME